MPDQVSLVLCQSTRVMSRPVSVSQLGNCAECDIGIWLAPSTVKMMATMPGLRTLCEQCSVEVINALEEPPVFALAPGALQEAIAEMRKVDLN